MERESNVPAVSVVLATRNEEKYIGKCLESILGQDYTNIREILVCDGMSDDRTRWIVGELQVRCCEIHLLDNPDRIQTFALNKAIEAASGDVVVRIDAHAFYEADYIRQCVHYLLQTGAGSVGGPAVPRTGGSYQGQAIVFAHESRFGVGVAKFRRASYEGYADTVWPGAFWRRVFNEVGRFREQLARSEDVDWNARLRRRGYKIFLTPKIRGYYYPRTTLRGLAAQCFANGVGVSQSLLVDWRALGVRHLVPLVFMVAVLGSMIAAFFVPLAVGFLAGIVGSYVLLCLLFSIRIAWRNGVEYLPIMPLVFWTIHFSYATGSLWGLLRFGVLRR